MGVFCLVSERHLDTRVAPSKRTDGLSHNVGVECWQYLEGAGKVGGNVQETQCFLRFPINTTERYDLMEQYGVRE